MERLSKQDAAGRAKPTNATAAAAAVRRQDRESDAEIAGYIGQMTSELATMASTARLDLLAYFLNLARLEAEVVQRRHVMEGLGDRD